MSYNINKILIATTNPGKVAEIKNMLSDEIELINLNYFTNISEIEEDGNTFEENARKKALGYAKITGCWTIADDSGLVIDALNGAPGVNSARFSGEKLKNEDRSLIDHRNIAKVLELLKNVPVKKRTARFICCLCLANPEKIYIETNGILEGIITEKEIGTNGFGYDPILFVPSMNKTVAQLTNNQKNSISHRGLAVREMIKKLQDFI